LGDLHLLAGPGLCQVDRLDGAAPALVVLRAWRNCALEAPLTSPRLRR
jgi:hypothetical protein